MGISNLLPFLRPITTNISISKFKGCRVGVDAMCWMHRGAVACAIELVRGTPSDKFLKFVVHMIQLLMENDITPVLVFDGDRIPAKSGEEISRRKRRDEARTEGIRLLEDPTARLNAKELQSKCTQAISITGEMVDRVIQACHIMNVEFVVAPFEADAQLAYMCRTGYVTCVVTEDSDLLAYGCPRVVFKMDKSGAGQEIDISEIADLKIEGEWKNKKTKLTSTVEEQNDNNKWTGDLSRLKKFNQEMFTSMCVLSGCDYISEGIKGVGIKTAFQLVARYKSLSGVLRNLKLDPKWGARIPKGDDYIRISQDYKNAEAVFLRHVVYDIRKSRLTQISESFESPPAIDIVVPEENLVGTFRDHFEEVARGRVHPVSQKPRNQTITELDTMVIETFQKSLSRKIRSAQAIDQSKKAAELNRKMSETSCTKTNPNIKQQQQQQRMGNFDTDENTLRTKRNATEAPQQEPAAIRRSPEVTPHLKPFMSLWTDKQTADVGSSSRWDFLDSPDKTDFIGTSRRLRGKQEVKKEEDDRRVGEQQADSNSACCGGGEFEMDENDDDDMGGLVGDVLITRQTGSATTAGGRPLLATTNGGGGGGDVFSSTLNDLKFVQEGKFERTESSTRNRFRFASKISAKKSVGLVPQTQSRKVLPPSAFRAAS
eukprot:GHVS01027183.1.p1 GENE.GHVS01027183.1~~GHVS01027183.1.p1  ORF type:complete len:657 (+),score=94.90 GHVS01027183.1:292-2262(+)